MKPYERLGTVLARAPIRAGAAVRRRAQDTLDQRQAVLEYVIANVPHAIFWKDREVGSSVSGYASDATELRCREVGVTHVIRKPFHLDDLLETVRSALPAGDRA